MIRWFPLQFKHVPVIITLAFYSCGSGDEKNGRKKDDAVNVIHHNEVFQTEIGNELNEEGLKFAQRYDYDNARELFLAALGYENNNPTILNNLGLTERALEDNEAAAAYFEKAIEIDTAYYSAYTNYALLLIDKKQYKKSLKLLNKAIKYSKSQVILGSAYLHAAFAYYEMGECEKSREHFEISKTYTKGSAESDEQNEIFEKKLSVCK